MLKHSEDQMMLPDLVQLPAAILVCTYLYAMLCSGNMYNLISCSCYSVALSSKQGTTTRHANLSKLELLKRRKTVSLYALQ